LKEAASEAFSSKDTQIRTQYLLHSPQRPSYSYKWKRPAWSW